MLLGPAYVLLKGLDMTAEQNIAVAQGFDRFVGQPGHRLGVAGLNIRDFR